jgi:hypothetical protein
MVRVELLDTETSTPDQPRAADRSQRMFEERFSRSVVAAKGMGSVDNSGARRKRGRPLEMSREVLLANIRDLAQRGNLFRVHRTHSGLYARARRQFGSWSRAVRAAGLSYEDALETARSRSRETRRRLRSADRSV